MKLFEEALALSQLEHQLLELKSRRLKLNEHVETQTQIGEVMYNQLRDMHKVILILFIENLDIIRLLCL